MCLLVPLPPYVQYAASRDMAHQALAMTVQKPLLVAELRWVGGWGMALFSLDGSRFWPCLACRFWWQLQCGVGCRFVLAGNMHALVLSDVL